MKKSIITLIFILNLSCSSVVRSEEVTRDYMELKDGDVTVFIELEEYPSGKIPDAGWWGHDAIEKEIRNFTKVTPTNRSWLIHKYEKPKKIIKTFKIIYKSTLFELPISSYLDLTELRDISLEFGGNKFEIEIQGGQTAHCYKAVLKFEKTRLKGRIVRSCEFSEEIWEKTIYSYINPNSESQ